MEMQLSLFNITFTVLLIVLSVGSNYASPSSFERSLLSTTQKNINDQLKQKHNTHKLKLKQSHAKRDSIRSRYAYHSTSITASITPAVLAKRPRLNFQKYDFILTKNVSNNPGEALWVPPRHTRTWTTPLTSFQHTWVKQTGIPSLLLVESLYAPVEVGHGYSTSIAHNASTPTSVVEANLGATKAATTTSEHTTTTPPSTGTITGKENATTQHWNGVQQQKLGSPQRRSDFLWRIQNSQVNLRDFPQCQLGYFKDNGFVSQHRHTLPKCTVSQPASYQ